MDTERDLRTSNKVFSYGYYSAGHFDQILRLYIVCVLGFVSIPPFPSTSVVPYKITRYGLWLFHSGALIYSVSFVVSYLVSYGRTELWVLSGRQLRRQMEIRDDEEMIFH
jgi:hypothetical protein